MSSQQTSIDCPNPLCAAPAALGLCMRFSQGFGLQVGQAGMETARWDDTHCLICGHFSSPYSGVERHGHDLRLDAAWVRAVNRALSGELSMYLALHDMGIQDLIAMRKGVQGLRDLRDISAVVPGFPHIGVLRVRTEADLPNVFGIAHGEAESEPFERKVRVLGRLLGARSAETAARHCMPGDASPTWYFYAEDAFIGLLCLQPNRGYKGTVTIDNCLDRLLHVS